MARFTNGLVIMFINPWIWHILNDEMPNIYCGDPEDDKRTIWAIIFWIVLSIIYGIVIWLLTEYLETWWVSVAGVPVYITVLIYGICKILHYKL